MSNRTLVDEELPTSDEIDALVRKARVERSKAFHEAIAGLAKVLRGAPRAPATRPALTIVQGKMA